MTGPEHFQEAERIVEHAEALIRGGDPGDLAPVWAALGQVHALLANAAAAAVSTSAVETQAWADVAGTGA